MDGKKGRLSRGLWWRAICCLIAGLLLSGMTGGGSAAGWRLFDVYVEGKYGLIDQAGVMVVEPQFAAVRPLGDGMIGARLASTGEWVCINEAGDFVALTGSEIPAFFSAGLAPVKSGGLYGYMNSTGKVVIRPSFEQAFPFREGRATVVKDGFVSYIDAGGKVLERLAFLRPAGTKADYIDQAGLVLGQVYLEFWTEGGGLIPFERDGKMGFLDQRGKVMIEPLYGTANHYVFRPGSFFNEKIMPVRLAGKAGFIDREGKIVVDFIFDRAEPFCEGLSAVSKDGRYSFIDSEGNIVVALQYEYVENFSEGLAAVKVAGRWGFIDKTGRMVIEPQYLGLMWGVPIRFTEGRAVVRTEAGTGYINKENEMIVPPVYWHGDDFDGGLAKVYRQRSLEFEYINRQGEIVWQLRQ